MADAKNVSYHISIGPFQLDLSLSNSNELFSLACQENGCEKHSDPSLHWSKAPTELLGGDQDPSTLSIH